MSDEIDKILDEVRVPVDNALWELPQLERGDLKQAINQYVNKKVVENVKNEIRHIVEGDEDGVVYSLTAIGQRATLRLSKLNSLTSTGDKNG